MYLSKRLPFKIRLHSLLLLFGLSLLVALSSSARASALGSATITISPGTGSYKVGDSFTVQVNENSGTEGVNAIQADLTYDKNVISFVSIDGSQSAFTFEASTTAGGGVVKTARAIVGSTVTGSKPVVKITFKVIAPGANSKLAFSTSTALDRGSDNTDIWNGDPNGGTYSFSAATVTPNPAPNPTPTPVPSPSPVTPTTSYIPSSSARTYTNTLSPTSNTTAKSKTSITPTPATAATDTTPQVLAPQGNLLSILVLDENQNPVVGATVLLDGGQSVTTDTSGKAGFVNVSSGQHSVAVSYAGKRQVKKTISVETPASPSETPQEFKVNLAAATNHSSGPILFGGLFIIIFVLIVAFLFILPRRRHLAIDSSVLPPQDIVVGGGEAPNIEKPQVVSPGNSPVDSVDSPTIIKPDPAVVENHGPHSSL